MKLRECLSRTAALFFAAFLSASLFGCGKSEKPVTLVPVTGTVKMGDGPLAGVTVIFTPLQGTSGTGGFGVTDATGTYTLMYGNQKPGIEAGAYKVTFSKMTLPDGSPIPEGKTAADVEAVQVIPPAYNIPDPDSKLNEVTVPAQGGNFNFEIPK